VIGIKVWVYKGEMLGRNEKPVVAEAEPEARRGRRGAPRNEGGEGRPGRRPARRAGAEGAGRQPQEESRSE
jgi:small subunit ribosomal protein S3